MAEGLNKVVLVGNLGLDPELRYTQGGAAVLRCRLATTETFFNRNKERQQRTEWHTVVIWGNRAEALSKILSKGKPLCVEGRIQYRQWEDKEGHKRNSTEIVATNIVLLGSGGGGGGGGGGGSRTSEPPEQDFGDAPAEGGGGGGGGGESFGDDDIPF